MGAKELTSEDARVIARIIFNAQRRRLAREAADADQKQREGGGERD